MLNNDLHIKKLLELIKEIMRMSDEDFYHAFFISEDEKRVILLNIDYSDESLTTFIKSLKDREIDDLFRSIATFRNLDEVFEVFSKKDEKTIKEFIQRKKSALKYHDYMVSVLMVYRKMYSADEMKKNFLLLRKGAGKIIEDEMKPLGYFSRLFYKEEAGKIFLSLKIGNQNYDALVDDNRSVSEGIKYIEITCLERGRQEHKLRIELSEHESAKRDKSRCRIILEQRVLLRRAIIKKAKKNYNSGTALIIYVSNPWWDLEYAEEICEVLNNMTMEMDKFSLVCCFDKDNIFFLRKNPFIQKSGE